MKVEIFRKVISEESQSYRKHQYQINEWLKEMEKKGGITLLFPPIVVISTESKDFYGFIVTEVWYENKKSK